MLKKLESLPNLIHRSNSFYFTKEGYQITSSAAAAAAITTTTTIDGITTTEETTAHGIESNNKDNVLLSERSEHEHMSLKKAKRSVSVDVLNDYLKHLNMEQFQDIKERTEKLCEELFSPEAERKRMGILKYHMKKREERLCSLTEEYEKEYHDTLELMEISLKRAFNEFEKKDDERKSEILQKSNVLKDKTYLENSDYSHLKTFFNELTDQIVQKNDRVNGLKSVLDGLLIHFTKEIEQINLKYVEQMKEIPFLDLETPKTRKKEIQNKSSQFLANKTKEISHELELIRQRNQELLSVMKKTWDSCMPEWKNFRYQAEQERFTKFVDKYISHSYIQEYFYKTNKDFEHLFVHQQEWMRKLVYAEPNILFTSEFHQQLHEEAKKLSLKNKEILEQSKKMMLRCESDLNEEKEILVEKFSMSMTECGVKSHYQVQAYLDDYFTSMCAPLFTNLKRNYEESQSVVNNNTEYMNQILFLVSRIIQEQRAVQREINQMLEKGSTVYSQIKDALDHIRSSIKLDMNELTDKITKANNKRLADSVMHEFVNLVHTFEEDTKNLRDQCLKMIQAQTTILTEILDGFHSKMCQVLDIQVSKNANSNSGYHAHTTSSNSAMSTNNRQSASTNKNNSKPSVSSSTESADNEKPQPQNNSQMLNATSCSNTIIKKEKFSTKCLPPLTFEHSPLDTSLMTLIHFVESKLDKGTPGAHHASSRAATVSYQARSSYHKKTTSKGHHKHGNNNGDNTSENHLDSDYILAILIPSDTLDQVKHSLQKTVIQLYEAIYVEYDLKLYSWKVDGLQKVEGWMSELGIFVKDLQIEIESLYRKSLYDIEEIEAFKSKQLQNSLNKLNNQIQRAQQFITIFTDKYKAQMKDLQENLTQKINKCPKQEKHKLKDDVLSKVSILHAEIEKAFQDLISGFNDVDYSQINEATIKVVEKSKKSVQERLRYFVTEIEGMREVLITDVTKRLDFLEFTSEVSGQERSLRLCLQSTWLKHESIIKNLSQQLVEIVERKEKNKEIDHWENILEMIGEINKFLKQLNEYSVYFGLSDNSPKKSINSFTEFVNARPVASPNPQTDTRGNKNNNVNITNSNNSSNGNNTNNYTMNLNKRRETFVSAQEIIIKKSQEKIYEKSLEFYRQKYQAKVSEGIPTTHSDFWSQIEVKINELRVDSQAKRQKITQNLSKIIESTQRELAFIQEWMLNVLNDSVHHSVSNMYKIQAENYKDYVKRAWRNKKDDNVKSISSEIEKTGNLFQNTLESSYERFLNDFAKQMDYIVACFTIFSDCCTMSLGSPPNSVIAQATNTPNAKVNAQQQLNLPVQPQPISSKAFRVKLIHGSTKTITLFKELDDKLKKLLSVADHYISQENRIINAIAEP